MCVCGCNVPSQTETTSHCCCFSSPLTVSQLQSDSIFLSVNLLYSDSVLDTKNKCGNVETSLFLHHHIHILICAKLDFMTFRIILISISWTLCGRQQLKLSKATVHYLLRIKQQTDTETLRNPPSGLCVYTTLVSSVGTQPLLSFLHHPPFLLFSRCQLPN